ncbi:MAG: DUF4240 domain-containing protein [Clostridiales Family XIII bacterium]|jgi:hypothetical protein|nr:DUF4240 domain-containing protein [Clostridiales Family XIII bacterium]
MDHHQFWRIIDEAREEAGGWEEMYETLLERLYAQDVPDLMLWKRIFDEYRRLSCKNLLWAAACIIKGGCSDDAFDCFRAWLIAQGKAVFLRALKDPETLAEVDLIAENTEFEAMLGVAADAYFYKLKLPPNGYEKYGRDYDRFGAELGKHPLPPEIKAAMAAEIEYAEDMDAPWREYDNDVDALRREAVLSLLLPTLYDIYGGYVEAEDGKVVAAWLSLAPDARIAKLEEWHRSNEHRLIIRAIESIPAELRDYTLTGLYARALNNFNREAEGLAALLSVEDEGKDDGLWHYRVAYSLYYTRRAAEALPYVERAIELGDRHPGTYDLWSMIREKAGIPDDGGGEAKQSAHLQYRCVSCGREQGFEGTCYFCRVKAQRERYQEIPDDELPACVSAIAGDIKSIGTFKETYYSFLGLLSCRDINTAKIAQAAFANGVFYPPQIYRDAPADVRDGLIRLLDAPDCEEANILLQCLAEIGDDAAAEAFRRFDAAPPPWREKLRVNASEYLQCADRAPDENGKIVPLYFEPCYEFVENRAPGQSAAWIGGRLQEFCAHCGCELVDLLVIDCDSEQLAYLGLSGMGTISVPICPNCAGKCIIRCVPGGRGKPEIVESFFDENYFDADALARLTSGRLSLSAEPMPPYFNFCPQEVATVGGRGNWVQDPQFADCPDCGRRMKLFAQLAWDRLLDDFAEGTLYVEICPECRIMAVIHQQT